MGHYDTFSFSSFFYSSSSRFHCPKLMSSFSKRRGQPATYICDRLLHFRHGDIDHCLPEGFFGGQRCAKGCADGADRSLLWRQLLKGTGAALPARGPEIASPTMMRVWATNILV